MQLQVLVLRDPVRSREPMRATTSDQLANTIDNAISTSPRLSFRRLYPIFMLLDNNFSDNRAHMLRVCALLKSHPRVRGWVALVTQNVLHDRELIRHLAASKCLGLFAGLESFDDDLLRRYRKTQNLSKRYNVVDDIAYAESQGISITYGYLFDPRHQKASEMERQICAIAENPLIPMPVYMSVVAPLAGTESFWADLKAGRLAPNLRLRDLDGETIAYSQLADRPNAIVNFVERMFRRPWTVVGRARHTSQNCSSPGEGALSKSRSLVFFGVREFALLRLVTRNTFPASIVSGRQRHARSAIFRTTRRSHRSGSHHLFRTDLSDGCRWCTRRLAEAAHATTSRPPTRAGCFES